MRAIPAKEDLTICFAHVAYRMAERFARRETGIKHFQVSTLDFPVSPEMSARIDLYLEQFRSRIPGADKHTGLWPSNKSRPMCANGIYLAVRKRTKKAFGFGVNLHRFRHAAASFWSSQDPVNVRGVKDVLGQASFGTTERHYIMAQSRLAGRALAHAIDAVRK
jgi:site-specific recombinase XerD